MRAVAITPAALALDSLGISYTLHKYVSVAGSGFGKEAADSMNLDENQVFKTIIFGDKNIAAVGIAPVSRKISTKKLAAAVGQRSLEPMDAALAQRLTGYVVGGISPFGQKKVLTTVIDVSAHLFGKIYVSGGRRGLEICIEPNDLISVLGAITADIQAE
jgi:Cys-tRNA(Pro)/Cys-tRNA(Cys) deacylase